MKESGGRILKDRRKKSTPALSRYILWGRRRTFRRKAEKERGGYVDYYEWGLLLPLVLISGLNILDSLFTMIILEDGGWEINPVVRSVIQLYGDRFWIWKFAIVSLPLILLCLHSKFRLVITIIFGISVIKIAIVLYQISIIY